MSGTQKKREDDEMVVLITPEAKQKQDRLVALCPGEVFWFGFVDRMQLNGWEYLRVYDIGVPKQKVSHASVDMEGTINEFLEREAERAHELNYFAHSHGSMGVFHSGTDEEQISSWARELGVPWFISHVQNKSGETTTRFDQFSPFRVSCSKVKMLGLIAVETDKWAKDQIAEHVTHKQTTGFTGGYQSGSAAGPGYRSPGPPQKKADGPLLTRDYIKNKFTTAKESYIRVETVKGRPTRQWVMDGFIIEEEDCETGEITKNGIPTVAEREQKLKENAEKEAAEQKEPAGSRSLARSTEKRVEGKATASQDGAQSQESRNQTQTPNAPKRSGSGNDNEKNSNNSQKEGLPSGIAGDEVYDEAQAAQLLANIDSEQYSLPTDVEDDDEFQGALEDDDDDPHSWISLYGYWGGEFASHLGGYLD